MAQESAPNPLSSFLQKASKAAEAIPLNDLADKATTAGKGIADGAATAGKGIADNAAIAGKVIGDKASEVKESAASLKKSIDDKITGLDRMLEQATTDYNDAFTEMNDKGYRLLIERSRAVDSLSLAETIVNSIANHPKSFDSDFEMARQERKQFSDSCEFAQREIDNAREAAAGAGAGLAAGAAVASLAPSAAMWVATTFGTASTGTAISALSGAAAKSAAVAWLGGGAVAAGGGGVAAGNAALMALAGPVAWGVAGAFLLGSIVLFSRNKMKTNKDKSAAIEEVKQNTELVKELSASIGSILDATETCRSNLNASCVEALAHYGSDYSQLDAAAQKQLGALVNNSLALAKLFGKTAE